MKRVTGAGVGGVVGMGLDGSLLQGLQESGGQLRRIELELKAQRQETRETNALLRQVVQLLQESNQHVAASVEETRKAHEAVRADTEERRIDRADANREPSR